MKKLFSVEKICGFYVSNMHLVTKILPYINQQLNQDAHIFTFLEYNLQENIETILEKMIIQDNSKNNILEIDWNNTSMCRNTYIHKKIKTILNDKYNNINILISGSLKYINKINITINEYLKKHNKKFNDKKISIINFYEMTDFNKEINNILEEHEFILNTAGIKPIEEVFEGYNKKSINY